MLIQYCKIGLTPLELHEFQWLVTSGRFILALMTSLSYLQGSRSLITSLIQNICLFSYLDSYVICPFFIVTSNQNSSAVLWAGILGLFNSHLGINISIQQKFSGFYYMPIIDTNMRIIKMKKIDQDPSLKKICLHFTGER